MAKTISFRRVERIVLEKLRAVNYEPLLVGLSASILVSPVAPTASRAFSAPSKGCRGSPASSTAEAIVVDANAYRSSTTSTMTATARSSCVLGCGGYRNRLGSTYWSGRVSDWLYPAAPAVKAGRPKKIGLRAMGAAYLTSPFFEFVSLPALW
jgi:hypothetical protein